MVWVLHARPKSKPGSGQNLEPYPLPTRPSHYKVCHGSRSRRVPSFHLTVIFQAAFNLGPQRYHSIYSEWMAIPCELLTIAEEESMKIKEGGE